MEKQLLIKRMTELSQKSYDNNIFTYSDFLSEESIDCLASMKLMTKYTAFGGGEFSSRKIVRFGCETEICYTEDYPLKILLVTPLNIKFSKPLTHRDYLGSIMACGVDRSKLGDIVINDDIGYIACKDTIASHLEQSITKISSVSVKIDIVNAFPPMNTFKFESILISVSSNRIDAMLCKIYSLSREKSQSLISNECVRINGKLVCSQSQSLIEGQKVTVKGYGKFKLASFEGNTQKGKLKILIDKFI